MEIKEKEIKSMTNTREIKALWSAMDELEDFISYFHNLPPQIKDILSEAPDVYGRWCEDEITFAEIDRNSNNMIALLMSFIDFMWSEMVSEYQRLENTASEEWHKMECYEASNHFEDYMNPPEKSREPDPCEVPDYEGNYNCPFDSNGSDDCRRHCGLGVDE